MVGRRLAPDISDPPRGPEPRGCAHHTGALLAVPADRPHGVGGHSAARAAPRPAVGKCGGGVVRLPRPGSKQKRVRRRIRRVLPGRRLCQHVSPGGGGHRPAVPLLPSRLLQRNLLSGPGGRPAGAGQRRICRGGSGGGWGDRDSPGGDLHGDGAGRADSAGIEGDGEMSGGGRGPGGGQGCGAVLLFAMVVQLSAASLPESIEKLLGASAAARTAFWGIQIVDFGSGKTLYELNPDRFFVPASNTKLFTTALALSRLGPEATFQTRVVADSPPDAEGRILGSLRLVGGGDPNLSARAIPYRIGPVTGNPLAAIEDLADQVAARGVKRIDGGIVGDDTWYLWQPFGQGWSIDDPQYD